MSPRFFADFTSIDLIRFWQKNLSFEDQQIVLTYFWSLNPDLEGEGIEVTDILGLLARILGFVPQTRSISLFLELSLEVVEVITLVSKFFRQKDKESLEEKLKELFSERNSLTNRLKDSRLTIDDLLSSLLSRDSIISGLESEKTSLMEELALCQSQLGTPVETTIPKPSVSQFSRLQIWLERTVDLLILVSQNAVTACRDGQSPVNPNRDLARDLVNQTQDVFSFLG